MSQTENRVEIQCHFYVPTNTKAFFTNCKKYFSEEVFKTFPKIRYLNCSMKKVNQLV